MKAYCLLEVKDTFYGDLISFMLVILYWAFHGWNVYFIKKSYPFLPTSCWLDRSRSRCFNYQIIKSWPKGIMVHTILVASQGLVWWRMGSCKALHPLGFRVEYFIAFRIYNCKVQLCWSLARLRFHNPYKHDFGWDNYKISLLVDLRFWLLLCYCNITILIVRVRGPTVNQMNRRS